MKLTLIVDYDDTKIYPERVADIVATMHGVNSVVTGRDAILAVMLHGNPVDGLRVSGPYESPDVAIQAGDTATSDWWVIELDEAEGV